MIVGCMSEERKEKQEWVLSIDVGTIKSGYCLIEKETYKPINFGKIDNIELLKIIKEEKYNILIYEEFASYGMSIGESTITSITWNGRYIQSALDRGIEYFPIFRREEKINLCGTMKAKDTNIRQALIDRFGIVGTKKNPGWFYGFAGDIWSAYAVGVTYLDKMKNGETKIK